MKLSSIRAIFVYLWLILLLCLSVSSQTRSTNIKALVGGTLFDGYGSTPIARKIAQLSESGVVLLIGTDSGIPMNFHSQTTWRELDAWVNAFNIDAMTAIRAAYWPSVAMRVSDQVGTVTEGKYADIIAVRGDVLRHIDLLQDVDIVIKHGKRWK
jgi:imidazolonepropionase-like amidohydrolase